MADEHLLFETDNGVRIYYKPGTTQLRMSVPNPVTDLVAQDLYAVKERLKQLADFSPEAEESYEDMVGKLWWRKNVSGQYDGLDPAADE
jgi:hypothetical protein